MSDAFDDEDDIYYRDDDSDEYEDSEKLRKWGAEE